MADNCEVGIERIIMYADIERQDGTILENAMVVRNEKLSSDDDIESTYGYEYIAKQDIDGEELYLGSDRGDNIIIKERGW